VGRLDPVIRRHCDEIAAAAGIVVVHPNWWGQPPAILKGWVDRVLRPDGAYLFVDRDGGTGVPGGRRAVGLSEIRGAHRDALFGRRRPCSAR